MALAPEVFSLYSAMSKVWDGDIISYDQKQLIRSCLPEEADRPVSEEQLGQLQETVSACEKLLRIRPNHPGHWLSSQGQAFPDAVHRFAFEVARHIFNAETSSGTPYSLPQNFCDNLTSFIRKTESHVATLNYDGLLSSAFEQAEILTKSGALRDGFLNEKFDKSNLFRKSEQGSWYLHLHGCPLFSSPDKSKITKLKRSSLRRSSSGLKNVGRHIVLTHAVHKRSIIDSSEILKIYWEFLKIAIDESDEIVLFGYSGNDIHLNQIINQRRKSKKVRVIEWLGAGFEDARVEFWDSQLGGNTELVLKEDILTFSNW
ncbi:SIR2 family protein [Novosphingobium resinovorum]|uniref:SIR2 family protein n=1 Tax=Novosphingobium resinovorum TaxID=158500 RepID=UPI0018D2E27A|nr:SIR2 family protein [Novosphingobium resinovorum]